MLATIGHKGLAFAGRDYSSCGYAVHLTLPGSGRVTFDQVARDLDKLEVATRRRRGSLRLEAGPSAHEVILHVAERAVLAETIPYPPPAGNLTIMRPLPIGLHEDGGECAIGVREIAVPAVGLRGSGKTSLLHFLIAQLTRRVDAPIFFIHLKAARLMADVGLRVNEASLSTWPTSSGIWAGSASCTSARARRSRVRDARADGAADQRRRGDPEVVCPGCVVLFR
jgi:hypothetical protein